MTLPLAPYFDKLCTSLKREKSKVKGEKFINPSHLGEGGVKTIFYQFSAS